MIRKELLEILACPICREAVRYDEEKDEILCQKCGKRYPIEDGIPIMLADRAETTNAPES